MDEALRGYLVADAGISALVGDRIAWALRPRSDALPSIALHLISGVRDYHMEGASGLVESRVQVDCWATTILAALTIARAVNAAIGGLHAVIDGVQFQAVMLESQSTRAEDNPMSPDDVLYRVMQDYMIWHTEDISFEVLNEAIVGAGGGDVLGAGG